MWKVCVCVCVSCTRATDCKTSCTFQAEIKKTEMISCNHPLERFQYRLAVEKYVSLDVLKGQFDTLYVDVQLALMVSEYYWIHYSTSTEAVPTGTRMHCAGATDAQPRRSVAPK